VGQCADEVVGVLLPMGPVLVKELDLWREYREPGPTRSTEECRHRAADAVVSPEQPVVDVIISWNDHGADGSRRHQMS